MRPKTTYCTSKVMPQTVFISWFEVVAASYWPNSRSTSLLRIVRKWSHRLANHRYWDLQRYWTNSSRGSLRSGCSQIKLLSYSWQLRILGIGFWTHLLKLDASWKKLIYGQKNYIRKLPKQLFTIKLSRFRKTSF